jgi:hypothetical protein
MNFWKRGNTMKEARQQKSEEDIAAARANAIRRAWMDRTKACSSARSMLLQLEGWLIDHTKALRNAENRCNCLVSEVRSIIANGSIRCLVNAPAALAAQLMAGRDLSEILLAEESDPQFARFYKSIKFTSSNAAPNVVSNPGDLDVFKEWNRERGACQILVEAIVIQKKAVAATIALSMEKFSHTVSQARAETARQVLALLAELRRVTEPDRALAKDLDVDEVAALSPPPFPLQVAGSGAMSWLLDAAAVGMIDVAELTDLRPETVSPASPPAPEHEAAAEPWLQAQI